MTAYLKAHWPVEFMAALLTSDIPGRNFKKKDSLVEHLEDCQRMTIEVLPPDVNRSGVEFTVAEGKICYALSAVKGCGTGRRGRHRRRPRRRALSQPLRFLRAHDPGTVNRTAIESLVKAGALDSLGGRRAQWLAAIDRALQSGAAAASDRRSGQKGLFDSDEEETAAAPTAALPDLPEWESHERLAKEKEVLGFYFSSHPLAEHEKMLSAYRSHTTVEAAGLKARTEVMLAGLISAIKLAHTKNSKPNNPTRYAMFDLEDAAGMIRCILWPDGFVRYGELVVADAIRVIRGSVDKRRGARRPISSSTRSWPWKTWRPATLAASPFA